MSISCEASPIQLSGEKARNFDSANNLIKRVGRWSLYERWATLPSHIKSCWSIRQKSRGTAIFPRELLLIRAVPPLEKCCFYSRARVISVRTNCYSTAQCRLYMRKSLNEKCMGANVLSLINPLECRHHFVTHRRGAVDLLWRNAIEAQSILMSHLSSSV